MSQDVTVNLTNPQTILDLTAVGVMNALQGGQWVFTQVVDAAIIQANGNPVMKPMAVKALRNQGHAIAAVKARQESRYRLDATAIEMEDWGQQILMDSFSAQLSVYRSLTGAVNARPRDPRLAAAHSAAETVVIQTGRARGMSFADIAAALITL